MRYFCKLVCAQDLVSLMAMPMTVGLDPTFFSLTIDARHKPTLSHRLANRVIGDFSKNGFSASDFEHSEISLLSVRCRATEENPLRIETNSCAPTTPESV